MQIQQNRLFHELKSDTLHYLKFQLIPELHEMVEYAWCIKNNYDQIQPIPDLHIPDGLMEVLFVFDGAYQKKNVLNPTIHQKIAEGSVLGIQTQSNWVQCLNKLKMMGIKFTPFGFSRLFERNVNSSKNEALGFEIFKAAWLMALQEKLEKCLSIQEIIETMSSAIIHQLNTRKNADVSLKIANSCINLIKLRKGNISVEELARHHHQSMRQIQRYFKQHFDISPKQYVKITRFKYLYKESVLAFHIPDDYWAYGYYDQAHFIKDFQRMTGISPQKATDQDFLLKNQISKINLNSE